MVWNSEQVLRALLLGIKIVFEDIVYGAVGICAAGQSTLAGGFKPGRGIGMA
jgi:hypothetical protein